VRVEREHEHSVEEIIRMCHLAVNCFQTGGVSIVVGRAAVIGIDLVIDRQYVQVNRVIPTELRIQLNSVNLWSCLSSCGVIVRLPPVS
jgi:hypothetical protein